MVKKCLCQRLYLNGMHNNLLKKEIRTVYGNAHEDVHVRVTQITCEGDTGVAAVALHAEHRIAGGVSGLVIRNDFS